MPSLARPSRLDTTSYESVNTASFAVTPITLPAGTYWLQLGNGIRQLACRGIAQ